MKVLASVLWLIFLVILYFSDLGWWFCGDSGGGCTGIISVYYPKK